MKEEVKRKYNNHEFSEFNEFNMKEEVKI